MVASIHPTECGAAVTYLLETLRSSLIEYENLKSEKFMAHTYNSDHAVGPIAAARIHLQDPRDESIPITTTLDWIHIDRQSITGQLDKLVNKSNEDILRAQLKCCHMARSKDQEYLIKQKMVEAWVDMGEIALAAWFTNVLLDESFSVTASGKPGHDCDSNFHESTNRDDKRSSHGASLTSKKKRVSLGEFLQEGAKYQISKYSGKCTKEGVHNLVSTGKPAPGTASRMAVQKAEMLLYTEENKNENYCFIDKGTKLNNIRKGPKAKFNGYVINSSDHLTYENSGNLMTLERAKNFLLSLEGNVDPKLNFKNLCSLCLGCHFCYQKDNGDLICTCSSFWHKTECSHYFLVRHLMGIDDLYRLRGGADYPMLVGRPQKSLGIGFMRIPKGLEDNETSATMLQGLVVAKVVDDIYRQGKISEIYENRDNHLVYRVTYLGTKIKEEFSLDEARAANVYYKFRLDQGEKEAKISYVSASSTSNSNNLTTGCL